MMNPTFPRSNSNAHLARRRIRKLSMGARLCAQHQPQRAGSSDAPRLVFDTAALRDSCRFRRQPVGALLARSFLAGFAAIVFLATSSIPALHAAGAAVDVSKLPAPKRVVIPKLKGKLKLDGKFNESVWKKAAVLKPFFPNNGGGHEREATELRLWYDNDALYLGWKCTDTDIQATFTKRDSKFWDEEVVECFMTAEGLNRYFELQWNPLNGVFDAIIENETGPDGVSKKFNGNWDFTAHGMKSAVSVKGTVGKGGDKDSYWQVEVMIPFSDLSRSTPKVGEVWRGNFYRYNRGANFPPDLVSWSPTQLAGFHQPSRFGYLEFGK